MAREKEVIAGCGHVTQLAWAGLCQDCGQYICSDRGNYPGACAPSSELCSTCAAKRADRIQVVVKGNRFIAAQAAADRSIPFAFRNETDGATKWTVGHVSEPFRNDIATWFGETLNAPFPDGACLHYSNVPNHMCKNLGDAR